MSGKRKLKRLLDTAGMDIFKYNTGVVRSEDESFRIGVTSGQAEQGDRVAIEFMIEGQTTWRRGHFTPARARVLARLLTKKADQMEETQ